MKGRKRRRRRRTCGLSKVEKKAAAGTIPLDMYVESPIRGVSSSDTNS
jgi:hypothetical protein